jgi:hypothetical protein
VELQMMKDAEDRPLMRWGPVVVLVGALCAAFVALHFGPRDDEPLWVSAMDDLAAQAGAAEPHGADPGAAPAPGAAGKDPLPGGRLPKF